MTNKLHDKIDMPYPFAALNCEFSAEAAISWNSSSYLGTSGDGHGHSIPSPVTQFSIDMTGTELENTDTAFSVWRLLRPTIRVPTGAHPDLVA